MTLCKAGIRKAVAISVLLCASPVLCAQALPWRSDWTVDAAPSLYFDVDWTQQSDIVLAPDGDLLLRVSALNLDDQIVRFAADGSVRWRLNIGGSESNLFYAAGAATVWPTSDGSVYAAICNGTALAKIDAAGNIVWTSTTPAHYISATGSTVLALDCYTLTAFDQHDGQQRWSFAAPTNFGCSAAGLVADAAGNAYASFSGKLFKFDVDGHLLWKQPLWVGSLVGLGSSKLYATFADFDWIPHVLAIDTNDGSLSWDVADAKPITIAGSPAELLAITPQGAQRLAADSGVPRWTQPAVHDWGLAGPCSSSTVLADFAALNVDSGAVLWTFTPPATDAHGNVVKYFAAGCLADGSAFFAARPEDFPAPPSLTRVNGATGAVVGNIPLQPAAQVLLGTARQTDAQSIASVAAEYVDAGTGLRVRMLNINDGSLRWEASDDSHPMGHGEWTYADVTGSNDTVFAALAGLADSGGVLVDAFARDSGARLWSVFLAQNDYRLQGHTVLSQPQVDSDGNVLIGYRASLVQIEPLLTGPLSQLSVVKLRKTDGHVLWRHDEVIGDVSYPEPPLIAVIGTDVFVSGLFAAPYQNDTVLKLAGADGAVAWSSAQFQGDSFFFEWTLRQLLPAADGNLLAVGIHGWAELDAHSGATLWSNALTTQFPCGPGAFCLANSFVRAPDGALWYAAASALRAQLVRASPGPNGSSTMWPLDANVPYLSGSTALDIHFDAAGEPWAHLSRSYLYGETIDYLAHIDPATGALRSQQALYAVSRDALQPWIGIAPMSAPANNRMLASGYSHLPTAPTTFNNALVDTTITANGNLAVQFTTDRATASPGQAVGFHLIAMYSGDAPITGAQLIADLPWIGHATNVTCTATGATNCVLDSRSDTILATFDMQPGGRIDITGTIRDTASNDPAQLSAIVVGPIGLNELVTADNAVRATVNQSLFTDGFE